MIRTTEHISRPRGFTLIEVLIATILIAIISGAIYISVAQTMRARDRSQARAEASARAVAAADMIAADARSTLRSADLLESRVWITRSGKAGGGRDGLLLFGHLVWPARPGAGQLEGDECEVQFRVEPDPSPIRAEDGGERVALWRRVDPVIDQYPDAGGVAVALVDGLRSLSIQATADGSAWIDDWDSDQSGMPHAIRITVTAADDAGRHVATARRVIAFDRVPLPSEVEEPETATTTGGTSTGTGTGTGTTTGGGR